MATGNELRLARSRLRLTQRELADRVGVGLRTVTAWEARGPRRLPSRAEGRLVDVIADPEPTSDPLARVSDLDLIAELARRLAVARPALTAVLSASVEDYPSDPTAPGTVGTPPDETQTQLRPAPTGSPAVRGVQRASGDPPQRRHRRQRSGR